VASPEGWARDPALVLEFYNQRRNVARSARPNRGHEILAELESDFNVRIITQNIDDLHERAGSSSVLHLHGRLNQARSTVDPSLIYEVDKINLGDTCELGSQLRPNIVWFGEMVPAMEEAIYEAQQADIFMVVGTSLLVYPAAGLIEFARPEIPKFIVDPSLPEVRPFESLHMIEEPASTGLEKVRMMLGDL
jgi:NAD-dependent deacetylase